MSDETNIGDGMFMATVDLVLYCHDNPLHNKLFEIHSNYGGGRIISLLMLGQPYGINGYVIAKCQYGWSVRPFSVNETHVKYLGHKKKR